MIELIYTSRVAPGFKGESMQELLEQARQNNATRDITGLLFFGNDRFIQILEGPDDAVSTLYATIRRDERHAGITLLHKSKIDQRSFGNWLMCYEPLSGNDLKNFDTSHGEMKISDILSFAQQEQKNYGAHLFGVLTGAIAKS